MHKKNKARMRRALSSRMIMKKHKAVRLCVFRSSKHIYAQVISPEGDKVLAAASTLDKDIRSDGNTSNIQAAEKVGKKIALKALKAGIEKVAFDRSGFVFHGRVEQLANSARENGLKM